MTTHSSRRALGLIPCPSNGTYAWSLGMTDLSWRWLCLHWSKQIQHNKRNCRSNAQNRHTPHLDKKKITFETLGRQVLLHKFARDEASFWRFVVTSRYSAQIRPSSCRTSFCGQLAVSYGCILKNAWLVNKQVISRLALSSKFFL